MYVVQESFKDKITLVFFVLQDYEHVTLLWERFKEFAKETELMGSERVSTVNQIADSLISAGHTDAATIAQWKDALNDAWADLGELIDTRYLSAHFEFVHIVHILKFRQKARKWSISSARRPGSGQSCCSCWNN